MQKRIVAKALSKYSTVSFRTGHKSVMKNRVWSAIVIALDGEVSYRHGNERAVLNTDNALIMPEGVDYRLECLDAGNFAVVNFLSAESLHEGWLETYRITDRERLMHLLRRYSSVSAAADDLYSPSVFAAFYELLSAVCEGKNRKNDAPVVDKAKEYIAVNLSDPCLSAAGVAQALRVSESYLRRLFRQKMSRSLGAYMREVRMERARNLLLSGDMTVSEIAERVGYDSVFSFSRAFKTAEGRSPSEYRVTSKIL